MNPQPYRESAAPKTCSTCASEPDCTPGNWECGSCGRKWFTPDPRDENIARLSALVIERDAEIERLRAAVGDARESIAHYLEHLGNQTFGTLIDGLSGRDVATFAASWVRNRLDEKWAAEVAANRPTPSECEVQNGE